MGMGLLKSWIKFDKMLFNAKNTEPMVFLYPLLLLENICEAQNLLWDYFEDPNEKGNEGISVQNPITN